MAKKVRILVAGRIGGVSYQPNDVINLPDALIKAHADAIDANKEAVAYALSVNGGAVIEHADPEAAEKARLAEEAAQRAAAEKAQLAEQIAQLEAAIAAADEAGRPAIETQLAAAQAQLTALG